MKINLTLEEAFWHEKPEICIQGARRLLAEILKFCICVRNRNKKCGEYANFCLKPHEQRDVREFIDNRKGIELLTSITDIGISGECLKKLLQNHDCCHTVS